MKIDSRGFAIYKVTIAGVFAHFLALLTIVVVTHVALMGQTDVVEASVSALPDLIVESIVITPPNPAAGSTADIKVRVKNQGDAVAGNFEVLLFVEPSPNPPEVTTPYTSRTVYGLGLAPGAVFEWTRTGQSITAANPAVYAWIDRDTQVEESNEANNLFPEPAPEETPDAYEDDNDCVNATSVTLGDAPQEHNLAHRNNQADSDWIKFSAQSGVEYTVQATAVGADADMMLELYSLCDGAPSFGVGAEVKFTAPATADYFIKASHTKDQYGPDSTYRIQLTAKDTCGNDVEPNDSCSVATRLAVNDPSQGYAFCDAQDEDWLRFEVKAGATYVVKSNNLGAQADVQLSLFNSCTDGFASTQGEELRFTTATSGLVYVKSENKDPAVAGPATSYSIEVQLDGAEGCTEDDFEGDDTLANAGSLNVDGPVRRFNTCPAGDMDWQSFAATAGITYTVETLNLGSAGDTFLCLHNQQGTELICDDDSGPGRGSRLSYQPASDGRIYFSIRDIKPEVAGTDTAYDLHVFTGLCKPDALEPDDTKSKSKAITVDDTAQSHNICGPSDEDWSTFSAEAGTDYVIATSAVGADADTVLAVYDASGNVVATNDDYTTGVPSQLAFKATASGQYFINVRLYNVTNFGSGSEYSLQVRKGQITPPPVTPTPTPPAPGNSQPNAVPGEIKTLILFNRNRLVELYDEASVSILSTKLETLAQHPQVQGEIIRLDNNADIATAYAAWLVALTDVSKANAVGDAIKRVILTYLGERSGVEYVVLVGDDRSLPFYRVADNTLKQPEKVYSFVDPNHPTGAALRANYILTDNYYVDRIATPFRNREIYLPDLAVGRLLETPADMVAIIDAFLAAPTTVAERALVSGYDFVTDEAQEDCADWASALGDAAKVSCLTPPWTKDTLASLQIRTIDPFKFQSINGHADHFAEGTADGGTLAASEIVAASVDLRGGLIYTPACHAGLNVPPSNGETSIDLAEAFARKGSNYVANTGYGWGLLGGIGYTEQLLRFYTQILLGGKETSIGKALVQAKQRYYQQNPQFNVTDEKVVQQLTFYGLPMFRLQIPDTLAGPENPFPLVGFDPTLPAAPLGDEETSLVTGTVRLEFGAALSNGEAVKRESTEQGEYYTLYDSVVLPSDGPAQPLHFGDVSADNRQARGVLLLGATYETTTDFNPLVLQPFNEFSSENPEGTLDGNGWYPPMPVTLQTMAEGTATLTTQLGQFDAETGNLRLFSSLDTEVYYSLSADQTPPQTTVVDGLYGDQGQVEVKVGATDPSGVREVFVSYEDSRKVNAAIQSLKLTYDINSQKWTGRFPGGSYTRFFVQVVDNAGNVLADVNKGHKYAPAPGLVITPGNSCIGACATYLPTLSRP